MSFLLTKCCLGSLPAHTELSTRTRHHISRNGYDLIVGGNSQLAELQNDPISGENGVPFWLVLSGYLNISDSYNPQEDNAQAYRLASLLRGRGFFSRLNALTGNFTILLVAPCREWCAVVRDDVGGRTSFFAKRGKKLAVSDSCFTIAALPFFQKVENPAFMANLFAYRIATPLGESPFLGINELLPGECIKFSGDEIKRERRQFDFEVGRRIRSSRYWVKRFAERFSNAVEGILPAAANPCVMLSGGLDSAPSAAVAAARLRKRGSPLTAISWSLKDFPGCDEQEYIREIASWLNIELIEFEGSEYAPFRHLDDRLVQVETPYFNPYRELVLAVYETASRGGHDVILNGNAGDLLYPNSNLALADMMRRAQFVRAFDYLKYGIKKYGVRHLPQWSPVRILARLILKGRDCRPTAPPSWLTMQAREFLPANNVPVETNRHWCPSYARKLIGNMLSTGTAYENLVSEQYGLCRRDPFVNRDLVRLFLEMPFAVSVRPPRLKWIMREYLAKRKLLPPRIIEKDRTGLLTPFYDAGLYQNLDQVKELLNDDRSWADWLDPAIVERSYDASTSSDMDRALVGVAVGYCLWRRKISTASAEIRLGP